MKVIERSITPTNEMTVILGALNALRRGDAGVRLPANWLGVSGRVADVFNEVVERNERMASELERLSRVVGKEGKLGKRGSLGDVTGFWRDSIGAVNMLIDDLVHPTSETARVIGAVAQGDLSQTMALEVDGAPLQGEFLRTAKTVNKMVDQLGSFAAEVTRVAREVGTEGKLGGQAKVKGVAGTWKDLTESVNSMASNLTAQVRNIADVTTAVATGDLSKKITVDVKGEILELKNTINTMVDQLRSFAAEVTRVAREVGTEGKLGGQADVKGVAGTWKDLTESVNSMASNLTGQVRNIADVTKAVAGGDLSKKITVDVKGEILELKNTINTMVDQLSSFASEVTRVAREVGTDGRLGGQADVQGVAGTWKDLTDSVNSMASNLTGQVRNIADVTTAVATGDLSKKITVDVKGEILELKNTINTMVDQLRSFASEVTRVAREVGTEGALGGQADVQGVAGTWKDLTESVNSMASNLTGQVRNIADVTKAVASGDLSKKITVDVKGEILELKNTINTMVDQLRSFASEVTRVAREVGTEGALGGQADVQGVAGTWKDLTESVNSMASNLTGQVRNIADVTKAVASGDLSKKITVDVKGEILELKNTINTMVDQLRSFASEVTRVAREVGTEGRLGGQADVQGVAGTWKDLTDSVNFMASNLTGQVRNIADVTKAVASGDLSKKITVDVKGEILELKNTINTMVDQLSSFASEVTRVAREVGTEGILGGQADVKGVAGTWKDLTDSVNFMAGNLTSQVRGIAKVVTAVANGALQQKLTVAAKGEIAALSDTINSMIDTLATFADQVTTVAREVGVEGKLGGQAKVPGASGTWKGLTENVNQLAANLTTQVRAIAEVATAVTQGDLTRSITVEARGEVAALKDTTNEMIRNLRDTTQKNTEQDWLKTNLAKFSRMLQGQKDLNTVGRLILSELAPVVAAQHAVFYVLDSSRDTPRLTLLASYGSKGQSAIGSQLEVGEGLVGQCAIEKEKILLADVPRDYITIFSGLGGASPQNILVIPVIFEGQVKGVLELASFERFSPTHEAFLDQLAESIGIVINTIEANTRTEDLLTQSQSLAQELQSRQQELQQTNQELEDKAGLLAHQNQEVERKNQEVEQARKALEEKAEQLALTSKYKSEVPGQHVARAAHAAQQPADPVRSAVPQHREQPFVEAGGVRQDDPRLGQRPADPDQRHSRPVEDRVRHRAGRSDRPDARRAAPLCRAHVPPCRRGEECRFLPPSRPEAAQVDVRRQQAPAAGAEEPAVERLQVHARRPRDLEHRVGQERLASGKREPQPVARMSSRSRSATPASASRPRSSRSSSRHSSRPTAAPTASTAGPDWGWRSAGSFRACSAARSAWSARRASAARSRCTCRRSTRRRVRARLRHRVRAPDASLYGKTAPVAPELSAERAEERPAVEYRGNGEDRMHADADDTAHLPAHLVNEVGDDRDSISLGDKTLLIVENDLGFARFLLDAAREQGFKGIVTSQGVAALALASQFRPSAISLDLFLPDINGWRVLHRLKNDAATRHIPVAIISTDESREQALDAGAYSFVAKPIQNKEVLDSLLASLNRFAQRPEKRLLVASADPQMRDQVVAYLHADDVRIMSVGDRSAAADLVEREGIDCLVLDAKLSAGHSGPFTDDGDGEPRLDSLPILLYGGEKGAMALNGWRSLARNVVVRDVQSLERLLDQASLFLHRDPARIPEAHRAVLRRLHDSNHVLKDKRVMIVDDDVRNIFALSSLLEDQGMAVVSHDNGRDAIRHLQAQPDIDVVLMDIMMPELDGVDTIREIRKIPACRDLPIIAVTAKAMKGDREKCMEAGAWDYLSKPVDTELMVGVLRAWLSR